MIVKVSSMNCVFLQWYQQNCTDAELPLCFLHTSRHWRWAKIRTSEYGSWLLSQCCHLKAILNIAAAVVPFYKRCHLTLDLHHSHKDSKSPLAAKNSLGKKKLQFIQLQISSMKWASLNFFNTYQVCIGERDAQIPDLGSTVSLTFYLSHSPDKFI